MPTNPIQDVQSVTSISKIIACDLETYEGRTPGQDDYTLFIVNDGSTNGETPIFEAYYGNSKLSQIVITETLPYPGVDQRVYIKFGEPNSDYPKPRGIYLYQEALGGYISLTDLTENGDISDSAVDAIVNKLYQEVSKNSLKPKWKVLT